MQSHPFLSSERFEDPSSPHFFSQADPFEVDLTAIAHTASFRKLQSKSPTWMDLSQRLFGTQLTHCIETAQVGEALAKIFDFPPQIMSAVGYAHSLGTPPLGEEGADALRAFAGDLSDGRVTFSQRAQTLRRLGGEKREQSIHLTAAVLDALLLSKQPAEGDRCEGGFYREEQELVQWVVGKTQTRLKKSPLAMLLEIAEAIARGCRHFEDALETRYLIKEHLLREIHALLLAEPQLSQWCESCFLVPIGAMSPYQELLEIKTELKLRLMRAFFSQVAAVRNSPAFYVRLVTLDYPPEDAGRESINLIFQYCPLLRKALEFLQQMVSSQILQDARVQTVSYARSHSMRGLLDQFAPLLLEPTPHHPLVGTLPSAVRERLLRQQHRDLRLRAFIDYICDLTDRECLELASCLGGTSAVGATR